MITQKRLKEVLDYNKDTGIFTWKVKIARCINIGSIAGTISSKGYIQIDIDNKIYRAHRLAWFYEYGVWPDKIDHIFGNKLDNRIIKLRDVTNNENLMNQRLPSKNNTTGFLGVCYDKNRNKYLANIMINYKNKYLGRFNTPEEAHQAYLVAKRELHSTCTI